MVDEWSGFAELLANLIEKYAADLDIDNLPDPNRIEKLDKSVCFKTTSNDTDIENESAA